MTERSSNIVVGLTAIAGLTAVAVLLSLFGYFPKLFDRSYRVTAQMPDSGGANESSHVWLDGIDVGQVDKITLLPLPQRGVRMVMRIHPEVKLPKQTHVYVERPLLGGSPSVALDVSGVPEDKLADFLPTDGTAELAAAGQGPSFQSQVAHELRGALEDAANKLNAQLEEPRKRLDQVADKFNQLSDEWVKVGQNLNQLFQQRTPEQVDKGQAAGNLATVLARADARLAELKQAVDGINAWANDTKLREDFRTAAANAAKASVKLDASLDKVQQVAQSAGADVDRLTNRFVAVADDLSGAIESMHGALDQVRSGKGSLGKFVNDSSLYDNLNDSAQRVGKVLDELKLLIEKWKKEGMPIHY